MARRLKKYWKVGLIMGLVMVLGNVTLYVNRNALISYVGMKMVDAQTSEVDPDKLTLNDFKEIPGVTQEYVNAYKLFLKAKAGDKQSPSYADAVAAFDKVAATTKNPELKLRSLYIVTLSNFLQGKIDEAYKSAQNVLSLSKKLYPKNNLVAKLDKVVSDITKGNIKDVKKLKAGIAEQSSAEFADDLNAVVAGQKDYQALKDKLEAKKAAKK